MAARMRTDVCGVWIDEVAKRLADRAATPIASSHSVGAAQADVWRSPIS